jgi:hypothetical protein
VLAPWSALVHWVHLYSNICSRCCQARLLPSHDRGELTDAVRRACASYVRAQLHKLTENVEVSFRDLQSGELHVVDDPGTRRKS